MQPHKMQGSPKDAGITTFRQNVTFCVKEYDKIQLVNLSSR